ncbi:MAG: aminoglycoside phosphotransferase family protein, partial [Bacteroidales bacterium]
EIKPLGNGLINDTFAVITENGDENYVLQRINHDIFCNVELLQNNVEAITNHIRHKLSEKGEQDIDRKTLQLVKTKDGKLFYCDGENYWRVTKMIPNSKTFEEVTPELSYYTGRAFGEFQSMLADLPEPLGETIPDFHNIEFRLSQLKDAIKDDKAGRTEAMREIIEEIEERSDDMCKVQRLFREGKFQKRTTHCDTKVNNILFDENGNVLCVIDLDTTMPGFVLSDFGDFIRTAGNKGKEDDKDLKAVEVNMDIFKSFARGYIEATKSFLTPIEKEMLPYGAKLLTFMQTVRFLTDYINGDTYYKISFPEHNKQRTLAQFKLLRSIEEHEKEMQEFINSI